MLPKNRRVSREEFFSVFKRGKRYDSPSLSLLVSPLDKKENSRFSFSVSKKVISRATERNKHRRWGYSIVSSNLKNIKSGYCCLFSIKKTSKPISFSVLEREIKELLSISNMLI